MSDTPIFDELTVTLDPDHAVFSLDPAAVLDLLPEDEAVGTALDEDLPEDASTEETFSDSEGES